MFPKLPSVLFLTITPIRCLHARTTHEHRPPAHVCIRTRELGSRPQPTALEIRGLTEPPVRFDFVLVFMMVAETWVLPSAFDVR